MKFKTIVQMYTAVLIFKRANNRFMQNLKTIFVIVVELKLKLIYETVSSNK